MDWKASLKAAAIGTISGTAIGLTAFFLLTSRQYPSMGAVLFLLVPVVAGFSIVLIARKPNSAIAAAALLSVLCSLVFLIAFGSEGVLCAVMAFPVILAGLGVGAGIGVLTRRVFLDRSGNQTTTTTILLLVGPSLIIAGERIERPVLQHPRTELVETTVEVSDSPERVGIVFSQSTTCGRASPS